MKLITLHNHCGDCKHFAPEGQAPGDGLCRRHAPQVAVVMIPVQNPHTGERSLQPQSLSSFPQVGAAKCWCSEFEQRILLAH
jgi:hypothetical protein